ncbi:regulator of hemoglobinization and erythroid cell expansion protein [Thomomys bottae]
MGLQLNYYLCRLTLTNSFPSREMELWHGFIIAAVSFFLQTCILLIITYLLTRHLGFQEAYQSEQILKETRLQAQQTRSAYYHVTAAKKTKETGTGPDTPVSSPCFKRDSYTSSDSLESSPPIRQDSKDVNYTQVVFSANGEGNKDSSRDYEDIKEAEDYVNVYPKGHKPNFWTIMKPAISEPVEYTKVAI